MFSLADSNFYNLSFFMNTGPGPTRSHRLQVARVPVFMEHHKSIFAKNVNYKHVPIF